MTPFAYAWTAVADLAAVGDVDEDGAAGLGAEVDPDRVASPVGALPCP